jgi:hypothetical protein
MLPVMAVDVVRMRKLARALALCRSYIASAANGKPELKVNGGESETDLGTKSQRA